MKITSGDYIILVRSEILLSELPRHIGSGTAETKSLMISIRSRKTKTNRKVYSANQELQ